MFSIRGVWRATTAVAAATLMLGLSGTRAWAQDTAAASDPNPGALTITGNIDFLNQYMFRGIRQNSTGMAIWPSFDLGVAAYSGEGGLKSVGINFGTWNSLHTGDTGAGRSERQALVRVGLLRVARPRLRRRHLVHDDLHGLHEPEQQLHDRQGDHVQAGRGRQRQAWQGRGEAVRRSSRSSSTPTWRRARPTAAPTPASTSSSASRPATRARRPALRFRSRWGSRLGDYYEHPLTGERRASLDISASLVS